jgi:hypothetical protein
MLDLYGAFATNLVRVRWSGCGVGCWISMGCGGGVESGFRVVRGFWF